MLSFVVLLGQYPVNTVKLRHRLIIVKHFNFQLQTAFLPFFQQRKFAFQAFDIAHCTGLHGNGFMIMNIAIAQHDVAIETFVFELQKNLEGVEGSAYFFHKLVTAGSAVKKNQVHCSTELEDPSF